MRPDHLLFAARIEQSSGFLDRMRSSTAHIRPSDSNGERSLGNQSMSAGLPSGQGPAPKSHSATSSRGGRGSGTFGMEVNGAQSDATGLLFYTTSPVRSGFVGSTKVGEQKMPTHGNTPIAQNLMALLVKDRIEFLQQSRPHPCSCPIVARSPVQTNVLVAQFVDSSSCQLHGPEASSANLTITKAGDTEQQPEPDPSLHDVTERFFLDHPECD